MTTEWQCLHKGVFPHFQCGSLSCMRAYDPGGRPPSHHARFQSGRRLRGNPPQTVVVATEPSRRKMWACAIYDVHLSPAVRRTFTFTSCATPAADGPPLLHVSQGAHVIPAHNRFMQRDAPCHPASYPFMLSPGCCMLAISLRPGSPKRSYECKPRRVALPSMSTLSKMR